MFKIALIGKKYVDTIVSTPSVAFNKTNECDKITKRLGGVHNLLDVRDEDVIMIPKEVGVKEAIVINETNYSRRTSFVLTSEPSIIKEEDINNINETFSWAHVCYLDDIEHYDALLKLRIPFSLDFCTDKPREEYTKIMKRAEVLFDSRERKKLYDDICLTSPMVLHDEHGVEIVIEGKAIHDETIVPLSNLDVNGAGDIYASIFIQRYFKEGLKESSCKAMLGTTNFLKQRFINNEKI